MKKITNMYRKLFFDYHMSASVKEILDGFDAAKWAEQLADANVEAVSVFLRCGFGYKYYQAGKYGRKHPCLHNKDLVEGTVRECHKRNIKVIGYYNPWYSEFDLENHPENCRKNERGETISREVCPNNPIFENELLPQVTEIAQMFDLDGMFFDCVFMGKDRVCHCKYCQDKFKKETGFDHIPISEQDTGYEEYVVWAHKCYDDYRVLFAKAVHKGNKDIPVSMNWGYSARCPESIPEDIDFLTQDCWPTNIIAAEQVQSKNWAFAGKPYELMNNMSLQWWNSYEVKPYETLVQECVLPMINGGKTWMGFQLYQNHLTDPATMDMVKRVFTYIKNIEGNFDNKRVLPYVGVLCDESQLVNCRGTGVDEMDVDLTSLYGLNRALIASGIPYNSVNEKFLIENADDFKLIIISNGQYVSAELYEKLKFYVSKGGSVLFTGKSGCVDINGNLVENENFKELTGVSITGQYDYPYAYISPKHKSLTDAIMPKSVLCADSFMKVKQCTAETVATVTLPYKKVKEISWGEFPSFSNPWTQTEDAAVCINKYGKGTVCYACADVFRGYSGTNNYILKNLIKTVINEFLIDKKITISNPTYLELTFMKDINDGSVLVNLLNLVRSVPMREIEQRRENAICEEIIPIFDTEISFYSKKKPKCIRTVVSGQTLDFDYSDGRISVKVPKVEIYEGVKVTF